MELLQRSIRPTETRSNNCTPGFRVKFSPLFNFVISSQVQWGSQVRFLIQGNFSDSGVGVNWIPPGNDHWSHIPPWEKENHRLKSAFKRGYELVPRRVNHQISTTWTLHGFPFKLSNHLRTVNLAWSTTRPLPGEVSLESQTNQANKGMTSIRHGDTYMPTPIRVKNMSIYVNIFSRRQWTCKLRFHWRRRVCQAIVSIGSKFVWSKDDRKWKAKWPYNHMKWIEKVESGWTWQYADFIEPTNLHNVRFFTFHKTLTRQQPLQVHLSTSCACSCHQTWKPCDAEKKS